MHTMKQFKTKRILVAILLAAAVLTDAKKGAPKDKDRPSEILLSPQDKELQEPTAAKKNKGKKSDPDFGQFSVVKNTLIEGEEDEVAFLKGQLELDDFEDLESLPTLKFKGLNQDKEKSTLVIHRVSQEHVSSPVIYRDASQAEQEEQDGLEEVGEIASVWYGEENGQGTGTASLMIDSKGNIFGSVSDGIKSFAISTFIDAESSAKIYQFEAFDLSDLPEEVEDGEFNNEDLGSAGDQRLLLSSPSLRGGFASPEDNMNNKTISRRLPPAVGTMVDVLVIYTSTAKNVAGGTSAMHNLIGLGMYQTNVAFANAGSDTRVRLVKTFEDTNFPDTSSNDAWSALKTNGDGHFDYVGSLRDQVGADVVMLIPQYLSGCGVAQFGGPYAAVKRQCATLNGQFSFAHEIGHLFGAYHDTGTCDWGDTNHGYINGNLCYRTIMSYNNCGSCTYCPRILAYSSTRTTYQGNPIGMSGLKNIETMDNFATILQGNKPAVGQDKTFILCHDNPCEAVPLIVNDQYNGDGKAPVIPGDNSMSKVFTPAGMYMEVFEDYNYGGKRWVFGNRFSDMVFGLYWFGAQNRISSFIIKTAPQSVSVMMCQDYDCSTGKVWRSVGSYKKMPAEIGDDDLSRVVLPPKFSIECFVHSGFKGHSRLFENGHATASLSLELRKEYIWWNDKVSSYTIATID